MAKVKHIEFKLHGEAYKLNINVGKLGVFRLKVPESVAELLMVRTNMVGKTLAEVENPFITALRQYIEATKTLKLCISVQYGATGQYRDNRLETSHQFGGSRWRTTGDPPGIELDYTVYFLEEFSNGLTKIYSAVKPEPKHIPERQRSEAEKNNGFIKRGGRIMPRPDGRHLPYSPEAHATLERLVKLMGEISHKLATLMLTDDEQFINSLQQGRVLQLPSAAEG